LNIQRGRDHGLADYNTVRAAYGLPKVTSFSQITADKTVQDSLAATYGSVDKLDLWVAGLAEKHLPGSSLGETFTRIIVDQFSRLRDGDRFWYQNALPAHAIREIQKTTLADIVRRNTQVTSLQGDVFFFRASVGGTVFADLNRDGRRQPRETGLAGSTVSLVTAAGAMIATTTTDARGNYVFKGLDLGGYKVVVTPPAGGDAVTSRTVAITRGTEIRDHDVGLAPRATTPPSRPAAPPAAAPARPSGPPRAAVFAALGASDLRAGRRPR
jgi:hypothetical protein